MEWRRVGASMHVIRYMIASEMHLSKSERRRYSKLVLLG